MDLHDSVKDYYGKTLGGSSDLATNACCCAADAVPPSHAEILSMLPDEVLNRFYGCGSPLPYALEGCTVLDLGCGTGRDVYLASKLVGPTGTAIGVDMTDEQLEIAQSYVDYHTERFGYDSPNVEFRKGTIEDLSSVGLADDSVDVVISNCVINLAADKKETFREIFRVLKPGGELFFSDVFSDRRVPDSIRTDPVMYGECLGGVLYYEDFRRLLDSLGIHDRRVVSSSPITIQNPDAEKKAGPVKFHSVTIRCFKLPGLEDTQEDYGQLATYQGGIEECPKEFVFDMGNAFPIMTPVPISGNTAAMVAASRYSEYVTVSVTRDVHRGAFAAAGSTLGVSCC